MCQVTFSRRARSLRQSTSSCECASLARFEDFLYTKSGKIIRQFLKSSSKYSGNGAENSIYSPSADARTLKSLRAASALKLIRAFRRTINGITQERMSNACHMDADLVRSTRLQAALDMGEILKPCEHLVMGHCGFSVVIIDCHLLPVLWASPIGSSITPSSSFRAP